MIEKLQLKNCTCGGKTGVTWHHISTSDFDYGPPKHRSSCLPYSTADQPHVPQGVTYISK